jgi:hypothetical protein
MWLPDLLNQKHVTYETLSKGIENDDPAICANVIIGLIRLQVIFCITKFVGLKKIFLKREVFANAWHKHALRYAIQSKRTKEQRRKGPKDKKDVKDHRDLKGQKT